MAHLGTLVAALFSVGVLSWLPALVIFLVKKDESKFVRGAAAGSLNFAINIFIWNIVAAALFAVGILLSFLILPFLLVILAGLIWLVLLVGSILIPILAAIAANKNEVYKYPLTINFIS